MRFGKTLSVIMQERIQHDYFLGENYTAPQNSVHNHSAPKILEYLGTLLPIDADNTAVIRRKVAQNKTAKGNQRDQKDHPKHS